MNITIVGPGAIGSLWANKLCHAGHPVSFWSRTDDSSISLSLDNQPAISFKNNNIRSLQDSDLVLVTVKAWQVESAITPLLQYLHPDTILMFMHNGMGAVESIQHLISNFPVVLATTTQAAFKPSFNSVTHTGLGQTQLGAFNAKGKQCGFLTDVLNHALPDVMWNSTILTALWNKLAINCAINPLTGLLQIKNGELANEQYRSQLTTITHELVQVINAEGIECDYEQLRSTIYKVINATAANSSSMQQDMHYKRTTEIDFITGYLIKIAAKHGIDVPENQTLYNQVKHQERCWYQEL